MVENWVPMILLAYVSSAGVSGPGFSLPPVQFWQYHLYRVPPIAKRYTQKDCVNLLREEVVKDWIKDKYRIVRVFCVQEDMPANRFKPRQSTPTAPKHELLVKS